MAVDNGVGDFGIGISTNGTNQYSIGIGIGTVETNTVYNSDYGKSIPGINWSAVNKARFPIEYGFPDAGIRPDFLPEIPLPIINNEGKKTKPSDPIEGSGIELSLTISLGSGYTVGIGALQSRTDRSEGWYLTYGPAFGYDASVDFSVTRIQSVGNFNVHKDFKGSGFGFAGGFGLIGAFYGGDTRPGYPEAIWRKKYTMSGGGLNAGWGIGSVNQTQTDVYHFPNFFK